VFLGADGLVADRGLCCPSLEQSVVKHAMLHAGGEAYVLADHSKLGQAPFPYWAPLDREYRLITDEPKVDVTYPQFAQSVILAGTTVTSGAPPRAGGSATRTPGPKSETVGGAAHDGRRGS
jgi:DeoR family transcriptional regulator, fructose operon transcriptional repressor